MLNDYQIALLLQQQYDAAQGVFDITLDVSGVYCSVKHFPNYSVICFRGSARILDFLRDFQGMMVPDPQLGGVDQGFVIGLRDVKAHMDNIILGNKPVVITGHSLGAARALQFAGLWSLAGRPVTSIVTFGAPRAGGAKLKNILALIPIRSYRNGSDPVCKVPFVIPIIDPYCESRDFIVLNEPPVKGDEWGPEIGWHHLFPNYGTGVQKLMKGNDDGQTPNQS